MPARQINFLSERRKSLTKTEHQDQQVMQIMAGVFGLIVVICLMSFGLHFFLNRQMTQVQAAEKAARSQIVDNETIERSFVIFVYKLTALTSLSQDKQDKNEAISFLSTLFGDDVFIKQMNFLEKERILSLRIQSDSIFSLKQVFSQLNDPEVRGRFASLNPSDLLRTADGNYEMSITAVVKSSASLSAQLQPPVQLNTAQPAK